MAASNNANAPASSAPPVSSNAILVSRRQHGNPVLRQIRNVPWQFGESSADYVLSDTTCCLFLSLRFHLLHPGYLKRRLRELSAGWTLRFVLLMVDSDNAERPVLEVTHAAHVHECTTLLAWSVPEAARYLEVLKAYARKPADLIKERTDSNLVAQLADCLAHARPLNKTDTATLHTTFGSLAAILRATPQELALCPGLGERKVQRLSTLSLDPFVPNAARAGAAGEASRAAAPATAAPPKATSEASESRPPLDRSSGHGAPSAVHSKPTAAAPALTVGADNDIEPSDEEEDEEDEAQLSPISRRRLEEKRARAAAAGSEAGEGPTAKKAKV